MTQRKVRVRFAPSPTGALHIGGVRTALYNYLFAKQNGGDMILRIEDTDSQRFVPGAVDYIIEALTWLGIKFDEGVSFGGNYGPYRQSERREIYKKYVDQLLNDGHAYIAFDTPAELEEKRKEIANFQYDASTRSPIVLFNNIAPNPGTTPAGVSVIVISFWKFWPLIKSPFKIIVTGVWLVGHCVSSPSLPKTRYKAVSPPKTTCL